MAKEETAEKETVDPSTYLDKEPTALQERFAEWIQEYVGYAPASAKTKLEAFQEGVRIATATRMVFQASDFNREANAASRAANAKLRKEREEAAAAAAEEEAAAQKKAPAKKAAPVAKKAAPKKAAKTAPEPEEDETEEDEAPVAKKAAPRRAPRRATAASTAPF